MPSWPVLTGPRSDTQMLTERIRRWPLYDQREVHLRRLRAADHRGCQKTSFPLICAWSKQTVRTAIGAEHHRVHMSACGSLQVTLSGSPESSANVRFVPRTPRSSRPALEEMQNPNQRLRNP